jgi:hypothetical protein
MSEKKPSRYDRPPREIRPDPTLAAKVVPSRRRQGILVNSVFSPETSISNFLMTAGS